MVPLEEVHGTDVMDEEIFFSAFPYDSINCIRFKGYYLSP